MVVDAIMIPREEYEKMKQELETLRDSRIYQRLLEFEENIEKGRKYNRRDLGF